MTSVKLGGCDFRWRGEVAARNESAVRRRVLSGWR